MESFGAAPSGCCVAIYQRFQCFSDFMNVPSCVFGSPGRYCRTPLAALLVVGFAAAPSWVRAEIPIETLKGLHPYATVAVAYDSNPLRRSDDASEVLVDAQANAGGELAAVPSALDRPESDVYTTLAAGFDTRIELGRQNLFLNARIYQVLYDRLDEYDNTGGDAAIRWQWVAGSLWGGDLGYTFVRRQRDFANESVPTNDMSNRNRVYATANRQLSPRWRLGGLANLATTAFDESSNLNLTLFGVGVNLDYVSLAGSIFGVETLYSEGHYWNVEDRDYAQVSIGPTAEWRPTVKTLIKGNIAYEIFKHDVFSDRDFEGLVGRLRATWQITGKTSVVALVRRDFSNLDDESANFAIVDSISVEPNWKITTKTTLRALASFQRQDYQSFQSSDLVSEGDAQVDEVTTVGIWCDWRWKTNVALSVGYTMGSRESTRLLKDYDFQNVQLALTIGL